MIDFEVLLDSNNVWPHVIQLQVYSMKKLSFKTINYTLNLTSKHVSEIITITLKGQNWHSSSSLWLHEGACMKTRAWLYSSTGHMLTTRAECRCFICIIGHGSDGWKTAHGVDSFITMKMWKCFSDAKMHDHPPLFSFYPKRNPIREETLFLKVTWLAKPQLIIATADINQVIDDLTLTRKCPASPQTETPLYFPSNLELG